MTEKIVAVKIDTGKWKKLGIKMYGRKGIEYRYSYGDLYVCLLKANPRVAGGIACSLAMIWPQKVIDFVWVDEK